MILNSPALKKILSVFMPPDTIIHINQIHNDVQNKVLEIGRIIGYIRWYSIKGKLELNFGKISYNAFIDRNKPAINFQRFQTELSKYSPQLPFSYEQLFVDCKALDDPSHDSWQVCCGHDLTNILTIILPSFLKSLVSDKNQKTKIEEKIFDRVGTKSKVEELLRLSYEIHFFQMTKLYRNIKGWETKNNPYKVLPQI